MPRTAGWTRHRGRWIVGGIALLLVLLLVAARLALTPVVARLARQQLNSRPEVSGDFEDLSLSVLDLGYRLTGLEVHVKPPGGTPVSAKLESLEANLRWSELLQRHLVAVARVGQMKVTVVIENQEEMKEMIRQLEAFASRRGLGAELESQPAFRIAQVEMRRLEILIADHTEEGVSRKSSEIWIRAEGTIENFADRAALLGGLPTTLALHGEVQRSAAATLSLTADPLADRLDMAGELSIRHLDLRELYGFIASRTKLQATGSVDANVTLKVHDARLEGKIEPTIQNLHVSATSANLGQEIEATLVNAGAGKGSSGKGSANGSATNGSDRPAGRNAVAIVIPISGSVTDPQVDLWSAFAGLLSPARANGNH